MKFTHHPVAAQLALHAGGDLRAWERWRVARHVSRCAECQREIESYRTGMAGFHEAAGQIPQDLNWARLSQEMTGNIRVGLAAGECIEGFEKAIRPRTPRLLWPFGAVLAGVAAVTVATLSLGLPKAQIEHLTGALSQVRWERIGLMPRTPAASQEGTVLETTPNEVKSVAGEHSLSLRNPHSDGATVSINMQDSAGHQYVDGDTGQVMTTRVYAQ